MYTVFPSLCSQLIDQDLLILSLRSVFLEPFDALMWMGNRKVMMASEAPVSLRFCFRTGGRRKPGAAR